MNSVAKRPSLTPSFIPSSKETSRVITQVESPEPHLGWHSRGYLPHWDHPGMIQSINFRLADSLPQSLLREWKQELGIPLGPPPSRRRVTVETPVTETRRRDAGGPREVELRRRVEKYLDAGYGACWLRKPEIATLMENAMLHFDSIRYRLLAWCIMPNHVHALIETKPGFALADVLHSWKSFSSHEASQVLNRTGEFWQKEYLDRYVRNAEHYERVIAYIEENPVKAGLVKLKSDWPFSSARFRNPGTAAVPAAS